MQAVSSNLNQAPILKCVNIKKDFKQLTTKFVVLTDVNLDIYPGEICIILGPSGSGKTTLLNIMAGIDKATSGQCFIKGVDINKASDKQHVLIRKKYISYIYQKYGLIPILSCYDNILLGQYLVKKKDRILKLDEIIKIVGIESIINKFPHEISGGQRQRVAIARAIVKQPQLMLCDEPTGALDQETSDKIIDLFLQINHLFKTTIIIVTHDVSLVKIAHKIIYLSDGRIVKVEQKNQTKSLDMNTLAKMSNQLVIDRNNPTQLRKKPSKLFWKNRFNKISTKGKNGLPSTKL